MLYVCDQHTTENTLIQLLFVCLNTLVIVFIINTHMPTIHMCTHHSKVLNPDTSSRENVEMIWLEFLESLSFPESRYLFFYFFYRGSLCCFSLLYPDSTRVQHLKHEEPHIFISVYLASDMLSHTVGLYVFTLECMDQFTTGCVIQKYIDYNLIF